MSAESPSKNAERAPSETLGRFTPIASLGDGRGDVLMSRVFIAASLALTGCSSVLGIDSDRHLVADAGPDAAAPTVWSCLDSPVPTPPAMATLTFQLGDPSKSVMTTLKGQPIPGLVVQSCSQLDFACSSPLSKSAPTDAAGRASLVLPGGFNGFFEVPTSGDFLPAIYVREPLEGSELTSQPVFRPSLLALSAGILGVQQDPTAGTVIAYALDCSSQAGAGVVFDAGTLGPSEKIFYLYKSLPSKTATATDSTGGSFVLNAPPGTITMKGTAPDGRVIGSITAVVRAGWVTFVQIRPSQATLLAN